MIIGRTYHDPNATQDVNASCAEGFTKLFSTLFGFLGIIIGLVMAIFTIVYLISARKIYRLPSFPKAATICLLVLEIIFSISFLISSIVAISGKEIIYGILLLIVFAQDLTLSILLIKLLKNKNTSQKELVS